GRYPREHPALRVAVEAADGIHAPILTCTAAGGHGEHPDIRPAYLRVGSGYRPEAAPETARPVSNHDERARRNHRGGTYRASGGNGTTDTRPRPEHGRTRPSAGRH